MLIAAKALTVLLWARTIYVSPTAFKEPEKGTQEAPFASIYKALLLSRPGDTVKLLPGLYRECVNVPVSGREGKPVKIVGAPGAAISGEGFVIPEWGGVIQISRKSHIVIENLKVVNSTGAGIFVEESSNVVIKNCHTFNTTSSGIGVWHSKHIIVKNNKIELACNDGYQESITISDTAFFEVVGNEVFNGGPGTHGGEGIDAKEGSHDGRIYRNHVHHLSRLGIYVDAWDKHTYNIEVFQNIVHDCRNNGMAVASEAGGLLENITIYNNIIYNNYDCGFTVAGTGWGENVPRHPLKDIKFINNTLYKNGYYMGCGGIYIMPNPHVENIVIRNNLCYDNCDFQIASENNSREIKIDHNLIFPPRYRYDERVEGDFPVVKNPLLKNPGKGDFHLKKGSPAIDSGNPELAPKTDFDGKKRPRGKGYDIGAFEF